MSDRVTFYRGIGRCPQCKTTWPVMFVTQDGGVTWRPIDVEESEAAHDARHQTVYGRATLIVEKLARHIGILPSGWPGEKGRT